MPPQAGLGRKGVLEERWIPPPDDVVAAALGFVKTRPDAGRERRPRGTLEDGVVPGEPRAARSHDGKPRGPLLGIEAREKGRDPAVLLRLVGHRGHDQHVARAGRRDVEETKALRAIPLRLAVFVLEELPRRSAGEPHRDELPVRIHVPRGAGREGARDLAEDPPPGTPGPSPYGPSSGERLRLRPRSCFARFGPTPRRGSPDDRRSRGTKALRSPRRSARSEGA